MFPEMPDRKFFVLCALVSPNLVSHHHLLFPSPDTRPPGGPLLLPLKQCHPGLYRLPSITCPSAGVWGLWPTHTQGPSSFRLGLGPLQPGSVSDVWDNSTSWREGRCLYCHKFLEPFFPSRQSCSLCQNTTSNDSKIWLTDLAKKGSKKWVVPPRMFPMATPCGCCMGAHCLPESPGGKVNVCNGQGQSLSRRSHGGVLGDWGISVYFLKCISVYPWHYSN